MAISICLRSPIRARSKLFTGDGTGKFKLVEDRALAEVRKGRWAAVTGDIDGDGRIDALLGSWGETAEGDYITIMRNRTPRCGSWAELVVKDRAGAAESTWHADHADDRRGQANTEATARGERADRIS